MPSSPLGIDVYTPLVITIIVWCVCTCIQIWDWDPESNIDKLLIDVDPLYFANDPTLNQLLDTLTQGGVASAIHGSSSGGKESMFQTAIEWTGIVLLKLAQIAIEILV